MRSPTIEKATEVYVVLAANRVGDDPVRHPSGRATGPVNIRDEEGILATMTPLGSTPLVRLKDDKTLTQMKRLAELEARRRGIKVEVVKFTTREHIEWLG